MLTIGIQIKSVSSTKKR